ncbi:hypothetical protein AB2N08_17670 [Massilia aurea]|uniref:hypothetical protein n=1 Tax=Massilia aurea TaxID=373040 RepID=UPI003462CE74
MKHAVPKNSLAKIGRIAKAFEADLDALTDEQIMAEAREDGIDTAKLARDFRSSAMTLVASAKRQRLTQARQRLADSQNNRRDRSALRPSLEVIKKRIQDILAINPGLAVAFRDGRSISDSDWLSLWDDFIETGAIKDDDEFN